MIQTELFRSLTWAAVAALGLFGCEGESVVVVRPHHAEGGQAGSAGAPEEVALVGTGGLEALRPGTGGCAASCGEGGAAGAQVLAVCGDNVINRAEERCDDGNTEPGDGCTAACDQVEAGYGCPTPGGKCVYTVVCGDGRIGGKETCDDGKRDATGEPVGGDGCSADCQLEDGLTCPVPNAACRPVCADGLVRGREQCDDANVDPGDGCNETCQLEPGYVCPDGEPCRLTVCGDSTIEGAEQCDDGNTLPYDDCSRDCALEPKCGTDTGPGGRCVSSCGDGILLTSDAEQCDDGNQASGDGCNETCQLEPGYVCTTVTDEPPETIEIPIVLRDFKGFSGWQDAAETVPIGHPDFERPRSWGDGLVSGIVLPVLGPDRKPVYNGTDAAPAPQTRSKTLFDQWYRDVDGVSDTGVNLRVDETLTLTRRADGAYSMDSATDLPWVDLGGFFPLDGLGWGNEGRAHNFHFTSELRYWFEYRGGEQLLFSGDDDVWVFINGTLAVDLGGVHGRSYGSVVLDDLGHGQTCVGQDCTPAGDTDFELEVGNIYEAVVFQAERHTDASNYWLTLTNFVAGRSNCVPDCGDGILTPDEACDLGDDLNTGDHGGCNPDCTLAPFCGDGRLDDEFGEACDNGVNASLYGDCGPGCLLGPSCGDGEVQSPWEECDDGKNDGAYGKCAADCTYAPRCGDGKVEKSKEECDEGKANGEGRCRADCRLKQVI